MHYVYKLYYKNRRISREFIPKNWHEFCNKYFGKWRDVFSETGMKKTK